MATASSDTITLYRKMMTGLALKWKVKSGNTSDVRDVSQPSSMKPLATDGTFLSDFYTTCHMLRNGGVKNLLPS